MGDDLDMDAYMNVSINPTSIQIPRRASFGHKADVKMACFRICMQTPANIYMALEMLR